MQLTCPSCSTTLDESHINEELDIVTCDNCHALFSLPSSRVSSPEDREAYYKSINLPVPLGYTISLNDNQLTIDTYADDEGFDRGCIAIILLPLMPFTCLFSILEESQPVTAESLGLISLIAFVIIGVLLMFVNNKKVIHVNTDELEVINSSLRFLDKTIKRPEFEQFYVIESTSPARVGSKNYQQYSLMLLTSSGKRIKVLNQIATMSAAIYFEKRLEEFFGIDDQAMKRIMP